MSTTTVYTSQRPYGCVKTPKKQWQQQQPATGAATTLVDGHDKAREGQGPRDPNTSPPRRVEAAPAAPGEGRGLETGVSRALSRGMFFFCFFVLFLNEYLDHHPNPPQHI
jgi:hypothetical protein